MGGPHLYRFYDGRGLLVVNLFVGGVLFTLSKAVTTSVIDSIKSSRAPKYGFPRAREPRNSFKSSLLPKFPQGDLRSDGTLYDVREFIDPISVSGIADSLLIDSEMDFVYNSFDYVIDNVSYATDPVYELWREPSETLFLGEDDCEGMANVLESILLNYIPRERMWVALGTVGDEGHAWNLYKDAIGKAKDVMTQIPLHMEDFLDSLKVASSRFDQGTPANKRVIVETLCANITWDGKNIVWDWKNRYKNLINQEEDIDWLRE